MRPTPERVSWAARWSLAIVAGMVLLVASACVGSLWYAEAQGRRAISAQEKQLAESELDMFAVILSEEGPAALANSIERRARAAGPATHRVYALRDSSGRIIAGNLAAWPQDLGENESWRKVLDQSSKRPVHVATRVVPGGAVLLAGRDDAEIEAFRKDLFDAVWVAVAIVAVTCLLIAAAITTYVLAGVRALSNVAGRVAEGDFSARAEGVAEDGPFGEIAASQNTMLDRIEDLVTGLTTVTDSLAHDLRTPLARTRRRIEEGLTGEGPGAERAALEAALAETDRTIATFSSLIDIARAEGGLSRSAMEAVDLAQLARDVFDLFEPLAQEKGVTLQVSAGGRQEISGHRPLLMQAASNLVHNAIKHAPEGSVVRLDVVAEGAQIALTVVDSGPGIRPEDRDAARRRFKQVGGDASEGMGLGLAIVDACARLHRGRLMLESNDPGLRATLMLSRH